MALPTFLVDVPLRLVDAPVGSRTERCPIPRCTAEFFVWDHLARKRHMREGGREHLAWYIEELRKEGMHAEAQELGALL